MKLSGVAAIVTGGGSGLGRATSEALAAKGAKVAVFDLNPAAAEEAAKAVRGLAVVGDVADDASAGAAITKAAAVAAINVAYLIDFSFIVSSQHY